ncbi:hypothetical protein JCM19037_697 [Geomicrobium sp. JCM 19037]|uniref:dynamin family protein n=1 Tax=Geomicrobium sp. JCM 19037 TaxID=1460634 RepID=UPI00045F3302|nr:dynamin family protein [Geomicrobium sp. JCM 19037]GAK02462.1 hypothetical protein JCM19037_697 [Geomicrobium sp. JCM 19037]
MYECDRWWLQHRRDKTNVTVWQTEEERLARISSKLAGEPTYSVAICGHFSAGKSTLINQLLGAALLPSSPIPTTANIMTILGGPTAR